MNEEYIANAERRRKIADDMAWSSGYAAGRAAAMREARTPATPDPAALGTCDWGDCDEPTIALRNDHEGHGWLPVCRLHVADAPASDVLPVLAATPTAAPDHCDMHREYDDDCTACRAYRQAVPTIDPRDGGRNDR